MSTWWSVSLHAVAKSVRRAGQSMSATVSRRCVTHGIAALTISRLYAARRVPIAAVREKILDRIRRWDRATSDRVITFASAAPCKGESNSYGRPSQILYPPVDTEFYAPDREWPVRPRGLLSVCFGPGPCQADRSGRAGLPPVGRRLVVDRRRPGAAAIEAARRADDRTGRLVLRRDDPAAFQRCRSFCFRQRGFWDCAAGAQACGTPVIAYRDGGATETIVGATPLRPGTGWFFDRQTPDCLARAIEESERTNGWFCPNRARTQAERFSTVRFEREFLAYLNQTM